jgi:hypothetical protein
MCKEKEIERVDLAIQTYLVNMYDSVDSMATTRLASFLVEYGIGTRDRFKIIKVHFDGNGARERNYIEPIRYKKKGIQNEKQQT